jgi:hypothetical protein
MRVSGKMANPMEKELQHLLTAMFSKDYLQTVKCKVMEPNRIPAVENMWVYSRTRNIMVKEPILTRMAGYTKEAFKRANPTVGAN